MNDELQPGDRVRVQNWPEEKDPKQDVNGREGILARTEGVYWVVFLDNPPEWHSLKADSGVYCLPEELVKL